MTQQVFADYIGLAPATLSSIFNGRTRPTLNAVEALKKKIPNISTDWLMFGSGEMYLSAENSESQTSQSGQFAEQSMLDFDQPSSPTPQNLSPTSQNVYSVKPTRLETVREELKTIDKPQRRIKEIRVFYDDQTWETFEPSKK